LDHLHRVRKPGSLAALCRSPDAAFHVPARRLFSRCMSTRDPSVFHLFSFNRSTVRRLLESAGFVKARVCNASLAWTTTTGAQTGFLRRAGCAVAGSTAAFAFAISFGRLVVAPSFVATAMKPSGS